MLKVFTQEHGESCSFPENGCDCPVQKNELAQYLITGTTIIAAGLIAWWLGAEHSSAVLGDIVHALADGISDMLGVLVIFFLFRNPSKEEKYRSLGNKALAVILTFAILGIFWITYERMLGKPYDLSPGYMIITSSLLFAVNALRAFFLYRAQLIHPTSTRAGIIVHASTDAMHSIIIFFVAFAMYVFENTGSGDVMFILRWIDIIASYILCIYISLMVKGVWYGHHSHKLFDMTLGKLRIFKKLNQAAHATQ